jgi:hypothetical protein
MHGFQVNWFRVSSLIREMNGGKKRSRKAASNEYTFELNTDKMGKMCSYTPPITQNDGNACIEQARAIALFMVLLYRANGDELNKCGRVYGMAVDFLHFHYSLRFMKAPPSLEDLQICIPNELRKGHFPYATCDGQEYSASQLPTPSLKIAQEVVSLKAASAANHSKISDLRKEETRAQNRLFIVRAQIVDANARLREEEAKRVELELEIEIGRKVSSWAATLKDKRPSSVARKDDIFSILDQMMAWYEKINDIGTHEASDCEPGEKRCAHVYVK